MMRTELLQRLKQKRRELAEREGVELFMVFTNKTLEETVKAMPRTVEDLRLVKGWGKTKVAKYGNEILEIFSMSEVGLLTSTNVGNVGSPTSDITHDAVFSVSEFIEAVNITLAQLGTVRIQGEISELQRRGSVVYFMLKDVTSGDGAVKCILWGWKHEREYNYIEDGMEVVVDAIPEIYQKYGSFNIRIEKIEPVGEGALRKAFEALQKKLQAQGYFDAARKRPLPRFIQKVGVITSEKGEAINDFLKNIGNYGFEIVLVDVRVEGDRAEDSIVTACRRINSMRPDLDVICLIRGGGGLENLRAFNTERVAEAVISSRIPVLTGIGHERDQTIAGLSSDADFSTPTKVADAIRRGREELLRSIEVWADDMGLFVQNMVREYTQALTLGTSALVWASTSFIQKKRNIIAVLSHKLAFALGRVFEAFHALEKAYMKAIHLYSRHIQNMFHVMTTYAEKMRGCIQHTIQNKEQRVAVVWATLTHLNPETPLRRGYSIAYGPDGTVIKNAKDVIIGKYMKIRLYKGSLRSRVEEIL